MSRPLIVRLIAWWGGFTQGTGAGLTVCAGLTHAAVWWFGAGLVLLAAGWYVDERAGRYARSLPKEHAREC